MPQGADVAIDCRGAKLFTHGSTGPLSVAPGGTLRLARCLVDTMPSITHGRTVRDAALQVFGPGENITVEMRECEARLRDTV